MARDTQTKAYSYVVDTGDRCIVFDDHDDAMDAAVFMAGELEEI